MKHRAEEEVEFDSICFHKQCIKEGEQLFSESNYSQALAHSLHKELCKNLCPDSFQALYDIPHRLAHKMMKQFERSLSQEITKRQKQCQVSFRNVYKKQANKAYEICMNKFAFQGCAKMFKKLMKKSRMIKNEQTGYLTQLFLRKEEQIEITMQQKSSQFANQVTILGEKILKTLQLKITELFFQAFNEMPIKQEEDSSQSNPDGGNILQEVQQQEQYIQCKEQQIQEHPIQIKHESIKPQKLEFIKQEYIEQQGQCLDEKQATAYMKKKRAIKHLDTGNIIQVHRSRRNDKVNYFNYHQYGNHSKEDFFQKAHIINSPSDMRSYSKNTKGVFQFQVLIINYRIQFDELIEIIRQIKPRKIKINAQIIGFQQNLLSYLPIPIIQNLVQFQQQWDCDHFAINYANCSFIPQIKRNFPFNKVIIKDEHWNSLVNLENVWISNESDIEQIIKSRKALQNLKSLKIQPLKGAIIDVYEIYDMFGDLNNLRTLVIKNITFNREYIDLFIKLLKNNHIKCLVVKNIENFTQQCINQISKLQLTRLIIHFKEIPKNIDFWPILRIPTLDCLSLKCMKFDIFTIFSDVSYPKHQLKSLQYLDLSNSNMPMTEIINCFHSINYKNIKYLNLENNSLTQDVAYTISQFTNLFELNLSKTSLNLLDFLKNFNKPLKSVEKLSLFGYYDANDDGMQEKPSILSDLALEKIFQVFPNLKHLNVSSTQSIPKARFYCPFSSLSVNGVVQKKKKK